MGERVMAVATELKSKETPLLFTPDNRAVVRAGIKTETRRLMKEVINVEHSGKLLGSWPLSGFRHLEGDSALFDIQDAADNSSTCWFKSPYGIPQHSPVRYWMREPVQVTGLYEGVTTSPLPWVELIYRDDGIDSTVQATEISVDDAQTLLAREDYKRPTTSLHMLKAFARTWVRGVKVWPEQLGDITAEGAISEGIEAGYEPVSSAKADSTKSHREAYRHCRIWRDYINGGHELMPIESFKSLWISINGHWDPEMWVWVIQFEKEAGA